MRSIAKTDEAIVLCILSQWTGYPNACRWCNRPLPSSRNRWCSQECERAYTCEPVWDSARASRLERDAYRCRECGAEENLHVHHAVEAANWHNNARSGCQHHHVNLITLCESCHLQRHHRTRTKKPRPRTWSVTATAGGRVVVSGNVQMAQPFSDEPTLE